MMKCPYCDMDVSDEAVECEDGCCPECGAILTAGSLFGDDDNINGDEYDDGDEVIKDDLEDDF